MRQRTPNYYIVFSVGVLAATLLLTVFRIVVMIRYMQINTVGIDYYLQRSTAVTVFDAAAAAVCAVCVFFSVRMGRKTCRRLEFDASGVIFTSALVGFMLLSMGLYLSYRYFAAPASISAGEMVSVVLAMLASIPFFYYSSKQVVPVSTPCALLALLPVLLAGARLIVDYSAQKDYPTSAISVYHILSLVALSLFFLNEGKFAVGKGSPASYLLFGSLSVVLLLVHALPSILLSAFWVLPLNDMDLFSAVDIACAAYILVRMASLRPAGAEGAQ